MERTNGRRLNASHPDYEAVNRTANDLAIAINPQVFFWAKDEAGLPEVMDEVDRLATVEKVKEKMAKHLEGGRFADYIGDGRIKIDL